MSLEQNDSSPQSSATALATTYELVSHKVFSLRGASHDAPAFRAGEHGLLLV